MQELLDTLENDWSSPQPYIDLVKSKLKKEKEQIMNAFDMGKTTIKFVEEAEQYYNQTYNK